MWLKDERYEGVVHSAWDMGSISDPMGTVLLKVSDCQTQLTSWNKKVFGNGPMLLTKKRKELEKAEVISVFGGCHFRIEKLNEEI